MTAKRAASLRVRVPPEKAQPCRFEGGRNRPQ
jgi:hypothetical protein